MRRTYQVYHMHMRNAQVYAGKAAGPEEPFDETKWVDFPDDPLVDIVYAEDVLDAVKKVAEEEGYDENYLYAIEQVASSTGDVIVDDGVKHTVRFEAVGLDDEQRTGIEITLPDSRVAFIGINKQNGSFYVAVTDPEGSDEEKVMLI